MRPRLKSNALPPSHQAIEIAASPRAPAAAANSLALASQLGTRLASFENATANMPGAVFQLERRLGGAYKFTLVSAGAKGLLGVSAQELERDSRTWAQHLDPTDGASFMQSLERSARALSPLDWQGRLQDRKTWVQVTARPSLDAQGTVRWTGLLVDITDHKSTELALERALSDLAELGARERLRAEALRDTRDQLVAAQEQLLAGQERHVQKEKMSALGRLANGLAHEINNPLAGVQHLFAALQEGGLDAERRKEYTALIEEGLTRIQSTVTNLLRYAQPHAPLLNPCDLCALLEGAMSMAQPAMQNKELCVHVEAPSTAVPVWADAQQMTLALANVLLNAAHASPLQDTVDVRMTLGAETVELTISDHGPGIPPEYLHRVCDPFFTTKQQGEGNGLGLSTAQRITVAHGGALQLETTEGKGTQVKFSLPKSAPRAGLDLPV